MACAGPYGCPDESAGALREREDIVLLLPERTGGLCIVALTTPPASLNVASLVSQLVEELRQAEGDVHRVIGEPLKL